MLIRPLEANFSKIAVNVQIFFIRCIWKCRLHYISASMYWCSHFSCAEYLSECRRSQPSNSSWRWKCWRSEKSGNVSVPHVIYAYIDRAMFYYCYTMGSRYMAANFQPTSHSRHPTITHPCGCLFELKWYLCHLLQHCMQHHVPLIVL